MKVYVSMLVYVLHACMHKPVWYLHLYYPLCMCAIHKLSYHFLWTTILPEVLSIFYVPGHRAALKHGRS